MSSLGSFKQIFENPLPRNPTTLIESLSSWNQIKSMKPVEHSSFTEIFGELHFKDNLESFSSLPPSSLSSSSSSLMDLNPLPEIEKLNENANANENNKNPSLESSLGTQKIKYMGCCKNSDGFSSKNSESLQLCTEGLGFESFDDVEESKNESEDELKNQEAYITKYSSLKTGCRSFPPPISSISRSGRPSVFFKSCRYDGRFVLKEIRIPTQELLHAVREDGRLKLSFVQPDEEIIEEEEEGEEDTGGREEQEDYDDDADEQEDERKGEKAEISKDEVDGNP